MCLTCGTGAAFDAARADQFGQRMVETLNSSAIALMLSLGHRTGLLDAMADGQPRTSDALAAKAGLSERYVREWLGAMVTGGIVSYDSDAHAYCLPPEHAAFLTRSASPNNLAVLMQMIGVLGGTEDLVADAFRHGRGVPYSAYGRFHEVMAEDSAQTTVAALDDHIVPLVPRLEGRLNQGIDVIDVGCGRGRAMLHLARRFPASRFKGIDLCEQPIDAANREASEAGLGNVVFETRDATDWHEPGAYDWIVTFDAVHDQAWPDRVLRNIYEALRRDGVYLMQDIAASSYVERNLDNPFAPFIYTASTTHCMSVSLAAGGMGLGAAWGREKAVDMLREAGFEQVEVKDLEHDPLNHYYLCRKPA